MPIYEFACPQCRKIYSFLSKRLNPTRQPVCPKCGCKKLKKEISRFALTQGLQELGPASGEPGDGSAEPNWEDSRLERAMMEMERDMAHLDENNPKHLAHMMRKMKELMPAAVPKEMDVVLKRLEAGEDPEKIEADMGDILGDFMSGPDAPGGGGGGAYTKDPGLYDY